MKTKKTKREDEYSTLGAVMRDRIGAVKSYAQMLNDKEYVNKKEKIYKNCMKILDELIGISALPEVEDIMITTKLPERIKEGRKKYYERGERIRKNILAQKRKETARRG